MVKGIKKIESKIIKNFLKARQRDSFIIILNQFSHLSKLNSYKSTIKNPFPIFSPTSIGTLEYK